MSYQALGRAWSKLWPMVRTALIVFAATALVEEAALRTAFGESFEDLQYATLQKALRMNVAAHGPLRASERLTLPLIVDISRIPHERSQPTDRRMLSVLIDALRGMDAAAIGIDIDFSPDDQGRFITPEDPQFFKQWTQYRNVRVGVYRRIGEPPHRWLGHRDFSSLAAGIMLPEPGSGYAYEFSSPDLEANDSGNHDTPTDYLLQMPTALYTVKHPDFRDRVLDMEHPMGRLTRDRIRLATYPIDFSYRDLIQTIAYSTPTDLNQWADQISGRIILVGDMHDLDDARIVPGQPEPVPGVLIHASALATLDHDLLHYIDKPRSRRLVIGLFVLVVATMCFVHYANGRVPQPNGMDEEAVEILASFAAALVVFTASVTYIGWTHLFWPNFMWVTIGFCVHPYAATISKVVYRGAWGFIRGATKVSRA